MSDDSTSSNDIAIVYLARFAEGAKPMKAFVDSCKRHTAGIPHDRVVVCKGFSGTDTSQHEAVDGFFSTKIAVPDDGFDITAYAQAAAQLPHKHLVFLNTFSEIRCDGWLLKLRDAFHDPAVGIAGATGSYESLLTSMKRLRRSMVATETQLFGTHRPALWQTLRSIRAALPRRLGKYLVAKVIPYFVAREAVADPKTDTHAEFEKIWTNETRPGGIYDYLNGFPEFPNPHIRTNAFMIERQLFLECMANEIRTKQQSYLFESGPHGLTSQVVGRGKTIVIVGCDGQVFGTDRWKESETFRLNEQRNLLVHDNQTRAFELLNEKEKQAFSDITWGSN